CESGACWHGVRSSRLTARPGDKSTCTCTSARSVAGERTRARPCRCLRCWCSSPASSTAAASPSSALDARAPAVTQQQRETDRRDQDAVAQRHPLAPRLICAQCDLAVAEPRRITVNAVVRAQRHTPVTDVFQV